MCVEHPGEKEMSGVEKHLVYACHVAVGPIGSSRRLLLQQRMPPRPKRSLTANVTLTRRVRRPPSPQSHRPKPPLRPPPLRWMPQRNPWPHPQRNPVPKPIPRPWMGEKPRPRPPFGRTRQAPALRCRAARTTKDKGQRRGQNRFKTEDFFVPLHLFINATIRCVHKLR